MLDGLVDRLITENHVRELDVESPLSDYKGADGTSFPATPRVIARSAKLLVAQGTTGSFFDSRLLKNLTHT